MFAQQSRLALVENTVGGQLQAVVDQHQPIEYIHTKPAHSQPIGVIINP